MKIKRIAALLLAVILMASLAACDLEKWISKDDSIYWLNFKPELDATLQSLASQYQEKTGVEVKVVTPESGSYLQTLREELEGEDPPTMFVINNQEGAEEFGYTCMDLTGSDVQKQLIISPPSAVVSSLYDKSGNLVGIPYCRECFGIAVNPDLLEPLGYSAEDIKNFDSLKTVAEALHAGASENGYDAFCSLDLDAASSWRVTSHLVNLEYYYEERDSATWYEAPPTLTGAHLSELKNLYDLIINNSVSAPGELAAGGHDPFAEFTSGKAAFFLTGSWDYAKLKESVPNVTIIPYYCGVKGEEKAGLNSGTENYWAVNAEAPDVAKRSTLAFMNWLVTDADASAALAKQLGYLPYKKAAKAENGFLTVQDQLVKEEHYTMDWAMKHQPNSDVYRAGLVTALTAYNADQSDKNWDLFKTAFVENWTKEYMKLYNN